MNNENKTPKTEEIIEAGKPFTLPSGKTAVINDFLGEHVMEADEIAGGSPGKVIYAMISLVSTIDEKPIVLEDFAKMPGKDVLKLKNAFVELNF